MLESQALNLYINHQKYLHFYVIETIYTASIFLEDANIQLLAALTI